MTPVTAAGWRIDPPVSVPIASGAWYPATAADDPPDDPPGMRLRSQGLWLGPKAEVSVDDPIANSSIFVLPSITMPACLMRRVIVASYGGNQPSRIFEPAVVGRSFVTTTSFIASGTPASGPSDSPFARCLSTARAASSAPSVSTCRNAWSALSTASMRSRWACATSTAEASPDAISCAISLADSLVRSLTSTSPPATQKRSQLRRHSSRLVRQDARDAELFVLDVRGGREDGLAGQRRAYLVGP